MEINNGQALGQTLYLSYICDVFALLQPVEENNGPVVFTKSLANIFISQIM